MKKLQLGDWRFAFHPEAAERLDQLLRELAVGVWGKPLHAGNIHDALQHLGSIQREHERRAAKRRKALLWLKSPLVSDKADARSLLVRVAVVARLAALTPVDPFQAHLDNASALVSTWPKWKQSILNRGPQ